MNYRNQYDKNKEIKINEAKPRHKDKGVFLHSMAAVLITPKIPVADAKRHI